MAVVYKKLTKEYKEARKKMREEVDKRQRKLFIRLKRLKLKDIKNYVNDKKMEEIRSSFLLGEKYEKALSKRHPRIYNEIKDIAHNWIYDDEVIFFVLYHSKEIYNTIKKNSSLTVREVAEKIEEKEKEKERKRRETGDNMTEKERKEMHKRINKARVRLA